MIPRSAALASVLSYSACQVVMIIVNKALISFYGFKEVTFLLFSQNVGLAVALVLIWVVGGYRWKVSRNVFFALIPLWGLYICYLSTGLRSLDVLSVPIYTLMKNSCLVFIAVVENVIHSTQHTKPVLASLFIILTGIIIGQDSTGGTSSSRIGILWMLLHMYFNVFYAIYTREVMDRWKPSKLESLTCSCVVSLPLYGMMISGFTAWEDSVNQMRALYQLHGWAFALTYLTSSLMGAMLTFSIFWICQETSALTLAVVGSFNKVPIVVTSLMIFNTPLTARNVFGLMIVLFGSLAYAFGSRYHPAQPVKRALTVTNVLVVVGVISFVSSQLKSIIMGNDLCFKEQLETSDDVATLIVKYPGDAGEVSGEEFVSQYLPPLFALLQRDPGWVPHKLPAKSEPLRLAGVAPLLLVNDTKSLLLHPELLPYIGSIFGEVLIESNGALLRVVRDRNWVIPDENSWQYLVLTSAVMNPSRAMTYVAIDASTAVCSLRAKNALTHSFAREPCSASTPLRNSPGQLGVGKLLSVPGKLILETAMKREKGSWVTIQEEKVESPSTRRILSCVSAAKALRMDDIHPVSANNGVGRRRRSSLPLAVRVWYDSQPHRAAASVARCPYNSEAHVDANIVRKQHLHNTIRCDLGLGNSLIFFSTIAVISVVLLVIMWFMFPITVHR